MTLRSTGGQHGGWVSIEGINGAGKTHLARCSAAELGAQCAPLVELPDYPTSLLPGRVIAALREAGDDPFLRTGHPGTETLLLAGLQVHRYEAANAQAGQVVLEDRGPHSVAVYQAAVITGDADSAAMQTAEQILATITAWRPLPDITLIVADDPHRCLRRFEARIGRAATASEKDLMARADQLYRLWAAADPDAFQLIDRRRLGEREAIQAIIETCRRARKEASCRT